jgi:hypothetical protein
MKVGISSGAEADVADGYWFYERQSLGLGDYFRSCIFADIESLVYFGGIHEIVDRRMDRDDFRWIQDFRFRQSCQDSLRR